MKLRLSPRRFEHITFDDIACYEEQFDDWMSYVTILGLTLKESNNNLNNIKQGFKALLDADNDYDDIILESPETLVVLCKQLQNTFPSTCLHYNNEDRLTPQKLYGLLLLFQYADKNNLPLQPFFLNDILHAMALLNKQRFTISTNCQPGNLTTYFEYSFLLKTITGLNTQKKLTEISDAARAYQETLLTFLLQHRLNDLSFAPTITQNPISSWTKSLAQKYPHHPKASVASRAANSTQLVSLLFDSCEQRDALMMKIQTNAAPHQDIASKTQDSTTTTPVNNNPAVDQDDTAPNQTEVKDNNNTKPILKKKKNENSQPQRSNKTRFALFAAGAVGMAAVVYQLCQFRFSRSSAEMSSVSSTPSSNENAHMSECIKTFLNVSRRAH